MKLFLLFLFKGGLAFASQIHTVKMKPDQILVVKTALGIATIIETPEPIQSAIIGDQSGFRVEYLDKSVTIKPLRSFVKTNLYLQTGTRRFDLRLETGRQDAADYIVYLRANGTHAVTRWHDLNKSITGKKATLTCHKSGVSNDVILLSCQISAHLKIQIRPEDVWITQNKESKVIHTLFLSRLDVSKNHPAMLGLTILKSDLLKNKPIDLGLKSMEETLSLRLPSEALWK